VKQASDVWICTRAQMARHVLDNTPAEKDGHEF
jgi:hypothetical protein